MKIKVFSVLIFSLVLISCQKQPSPQLSEGELKTQFEEADQQISLYLDILDDINDKQK